MFLKFNNLLLNHPLREKCDYLEASNVCTKAEWIFEPCGKRSLV
jgi:hypothetical protein